VTRGRNARAIARKNAGENSEWGKSGVKRFSIFRAGLSVHAGLVITTRDSAADNEQFVNLP